MRRLFAIALVALLVGGGLVAILETDPGYVLVAYGNYTLESSLWVGLVLLVVLVLVVFLLLRLIFQILSGQQTLLTWLGARKSRNAQRLTNRGLIGFIEGNWHTARRQLLRGAEHNDSPLLNYLLAARASAQLQDDDKVHEYLRAARDAEPGAAMVVEIVLAELKLQAGEYQQALAALDHSLRNPGRQPQVLRLVLQAYQGLQDWDKLLDLLAQLQKHKVLSAEDFQQLERQVVRHRLEQDFTDLEQLRTMWQKVPRQLQNEGDLLALYVRQLILLADHINAEKTILLALKQSWQVGLVRLYADVEADPARQLAKAETWLDEHPEQPELMLCLGRLSARAALWGKARHYFESAYRLQRTAETCAELGRLLDALGEPAVAAAYFREGLMMQQDKSLALPWPENNLPVPRIAASL